MPLATLVTGSTVVVQTEVSSQGTMGGSAFTYTDGTSSLDCNAQVMSAREAKDYDTRGERRMWNVFFAADPSLTPRHRLKLTLWQGIDYSDSPILLRVLSTDAEGRPNQALYWVAICEEVSQRMEA